MSVIKIHRYIKSKIKMNEHLNYSETRGDTLIRSWYTKATGRA